MRFNHVESFYAFLLHFCSKLSKETGQPTTARPSASLAGAVAKAPCKGATDYGQGPLYRGRSAVASLQGRLPPAGTVACSMAPAGATGCRVAPAKGGQLQGDARKGRPLTARATANKGSGIGHRGDDGNVVMVREEG
ncbi:hypothetical protein BHE74_00056404 [Ensete ventricosum]|nr:hypothetical protein BHE74_00056404 [Ensete ventricosum]